MPPTNRSPLVLYVDLKRTLVPSFTEYPFNLPCVRDLRRLELHPEVTILVGENGMGKSSLLEGVAVAAGFNPEGGSRHFRFETRASHSALGRYLRIVRGRPVAGGYFLRAESFFNVATHIDELDRVPAPAPPIIDSYGGTSLHAQSHGESFLALLNRRFSPGGFYVLDEPEAALSVKNQVSALVRIRSLAREGAQFLLATHSPILMAYPGALIYELSECGIREVTYDEVDHVTRAREFLADPTAAMAEVLDV